MLVSAYLPGAPLHMFGNRQHLCTMHGAPTAATQLLLPVQQIQVSAIEDAYAVTMCIWSELVHNITAVHIFLCCASKVLALKWHCTAFAQGVVRHHNKFLCDRLA